MVLVRPAPGPGSAVEAIAPETLDVAGVRIRAARGTDRAFVLETARRLAGLEPPASRSREQVVGAEVATLTAYFGWLRRARRRVMTLLEGRQRAEILLAQSPSGERLGFAFLHRAVDYYTRQDVCYLSVIAVAAHAEGRGVGSALLHAVECWARDRGHAMILLNVFAANAVARGVYEHHGYVCETVRYVKVLAPQAAAGPGPAKAAGVPPPGRDVRL